MPQEFRVQPNRDALGLSIGANPRFFRVIHTWPRRPALGAGVVGFWVGGSWDRIGGAYLNRVALGVPLHYWAGLGQDGEAKQAVSLPPRVALGGLGCNKEPPL